MPASYAHYRFGREVLDTMPEDVRQCVHRFRRMYDMGLYGPDIFFFYNPLMKNSAWDINRSYHAKTGQELFPAACAQASTEAARAYLYGLLAHYCLDAACHPFIQRKADSGEAGHALLEAEFDRCLMALDKIPQPHLYDQSPRMKLTRGECMTVAEFYPPAEGGMVDLSVKNMARMYKFISGTRRDRAEKLMKRVKPGFCSFLIPREPIEAYARMDSELLARFNRAVKHYPVLLEQLRQHRQTGEALGEDFLPDFG